MTLNVTCYLTNYYHNYKYYSCPRDGAVVFAFKRPRMKPVQQPTPSEAADQEPPSKKQRKSGNGPAQTEEHNSEDESSEEGECNSRLHLKGFSVHKCI